jgi:YidC/Oxa1 family membrane protein insertase
MNPITYLVDNIMLPFLNFSYTNIFPNYGFAIILLTILIKLAFYPLTHKQFHAMKIMQKIQPKIKEVQAKHKKEPEKLQKEMLNIWKEHKVNPLSGCLPLLIQLPFLFALFYTMNSEAFRVLISQEGVNSGLFSFWLPNLGLPDTTYLLPIIIALTTYLSQKLSMNKDSAGPQATMMMVMPFVIFVICLKLPAGVLLYWAASQIISSAQQMIIMKKA